MSGLNRKPRVGELLEHYPNWPDKDGGRQALGHVISIEGNLCWYRKPDGSSSLCIWKFSDGLNQNVAVAS